MDVSMLLLIVCGLGYASVLPAGPPLRLSTVSNNGRPRNIIPQGAAWNFGPGSLWTQRGWQYAAYWDDACQVPPGTRYINNGSMTVDATGRVHVLVRGEDGSPTHFQRDPATAKWTRQPAACHGTLLPWEKDQIFVVSDVGLHRSSASWLWTMKQFAVGHPELFEDNCPQSIGGGGTPRQPLAPPLRRPSANK